jgi:O-antigen ligase
MITKPRYTPVQNIQFVLACLFFASLNFEVFSPIVPDFSVAKMAAFLYIGVLFLTPKKLFSTRNIGLPLVSVFAMFFLMVLSSIIHMQSNSSIFDTTLFLNIIMFWLLLNHHRRDPRVFHQGLLWFSISSFVVGLCYYLNIGVSIDESMRIVVFGENANGLGVKMGVGALFLFNYCLNHSLERPIYRPWLIVMSVPMVSLLLMTASRVALLVLASGAILFVLLRQTKRKFTKFIWLVLGLMALYIGYQIVLDQEVLMTRMEKTIDEGNVSGRDYIWEKYIELIKEHPVLGVGFTGAEQYALQVFGKARSPHNVIIEVALYSGVLGLACFLLFLFYVYRDAWLYRKKRNNLGPLITSMAILGLVLSGQALGVKLFWVLAAYAISYEVEKYKTEEILLTELSVG